MAEPREVCKICFGSTSHKPTPTLTPENRASYDPGTKKKKCAVCRHEWAPIRVAKEVGPGPPKWVRIRFRPKGVPPDIDFQICKNIQGRAECPKGQDCTYAHSRIELLTWNREREKEPRPAPAINGPYQYQLCKHMLNTSTCPYGRRCTFAHSEEELKSWLSTQAEGYPVNPHVGQISPTLGVISEFRCDICSLTCTSKKQLDDHISGARHKQQVATKALLAYDNPASVHVQGMGKDPTLRRRPLLSFPINGYKLCLHVQSGRRCIYGEYCTFAHSQRELEEWNRQLQMANTPRASGILRFQNAPHMVVPPSSSAVDRKPDVFAESGLDDFEDEFAPENQDFAYVMRSRLSLEQKQRQSIQGFEKSKDNVTILEVSGQELSLVWPQSSNVHWTFEVSTILPRNLQSVILFDVLAGDFSLEGVWLVKFGGHQIPLSGTKALQGVGVQLNQRITPPDKVLVKVSLKPRSGILGQLIIFDFGSFHLVRALTVHVLNESETTLLQGASTPRSKRPSKPDLYWEQRYSQITMATSYLEPTDHQLPEYPLPEQIERLIEAGKYNNVEIRVTKENYKRRAHNLLYLEEYQQRVGMSRYDLYDVEIAPCKEYHTPGGGTNYAPNGYFFVKVTMDEVLFEGGRSVRPTDGALLLPNNQHVVHECFVEHVGRESIVLKITEKAKQASESSLNQCRIRFFLSRVQMRAMHYAVDHLSLDSIFPSTTTASPHIETSPAIKKCLDELKQSELYASQQSAITSTLDPACRGVPSLVLGPFGCGKTRTLGECIKLLALHVEETKILICTHSNSAANLYVESLDQEWKKRGMQKAPMFRVYYTGRRLNTVPYNVRRYCKIDEVGQLAIPSLPELRSFKIIVATLQTSRALSLLGLPKGHFTHVFIDEAAQALESETLIPLSLADENCKIVLAGDHMQMDPPVYSPIAKKYGLHVSLLERLYDHEVYDSGVGQLCKTLLTENHRSHQQILELPSKLFYKNMLTCKAVFPSTGPKDMPAIKFIGVDGHESQDEDSPSYYNDHETIKIAEQVRQLVVRGLRPVDVCVLSYYAKQVQRLRHMLRKHDLGQVVVCRVDDIQGREYRALLLSTVRTCSSDPSEEEGGFLTNPKLFNTAVTRAREWLIVVGEPITLCTVGSNRLCWMEFMRKCHQLGTFDYPNAADFESFLETRLVARQILEKTYEGFFKKVHSMLHPSQSQVQQDSRPPPSNPHPTPPSPSVGPPHPMAAFVQASPQVQQQILRSKVKEASHSGDEAVINRITDEFQKFPLQQLVVLLSQQEHFTTRVREMEQLLRRGGPTAAVMGSTRMQAPLLSQTAPGMPSQGHTYPGVPGPYATGHAPNHLGPIGSTMPPSLAVLTADLPPFLKSVIEALSAHAKFCDYNLQNNPQLSQEAKQNLVKQRNNVAHQMNLVNEQIRLYREFAMIVKSTQAAAAAAAAAMTSKAPNISTAPSMPQAVGGASQLPPGVPTAPRMHYAHQVPQPPPNAAVPHMRPPVNSTHPQVNSAFTYGMSVSPYLPNAQDQHQPQLTVQTKPAAAKKVSGSGSTGKGLSPLGAAISNAANRSSPISHPVAHHQDDLYVSDDEFNNE